MSTRSIRPHHQKAIDRLVEEYEHHPDYLGLIIGGSVAKGCARDDSDVDFIIVATDEQFHRRCAENDLFINRTDLCSYQGGFVDGKVVNMGYLEQVAVRGNEPSRAAFQNAFLGFSRDDGAMADSSLWSRLSLSSSPSGLARTTANFLRWNALLT